MSLQKIDPDVKMEIIINMAWGTPIKDISKAYNIAEEKIINLRKNNYKLYNEILESFYIVDEVAILGLSPIHERAINTLKRKYKNKFTIIDKNNFLLNGKKIFINDIIVLVNEIIARDNIPPIGSFIGMKNYYQSNQKPIKRSKSCKQKLKK